MAKNKVNLSELPYSKLTIIWLFFYMAMNFIFGIIQVRTLTLPFIILGLINIYALTLLFRLKKQGFYILLSCEIVILLYSYFNHLNMSISLVGFFGILITWTCIRSYWINMS